MSKAGKLTIQSPPQMLDGRAYWICECACGNIVLLTKEEILDGEGCGQACLASRGEVCAADIFNELKIRYEVQKKFEDFDLRFDFYLPDYNLIIECDGAQHFRALNSDWNSAFKLQETRERDKRKIEYCKNAGITFLQIPFWNKEKLTIEYVRRLINEVGN